MKNVIRQIKKALKNIGKKGMVILTPLGYDRYSVDVDGEGIGVFDVSCDAFVDGDSEGLCEDVIEMEDSICLNFEIQGDWKSNMEKVSEIIKFVKEEHPSMDVHIQVVIK